jgi:membrane associated rhomboid family serine protease
MGSFGDFRDRFNQSLNRYLTPAVKWILLANVGVFLIIGFFVLPFGREDEFLRIFAQNPIVKFASEPGGGFAIKFNWLCTLQFFTYMFVHVEVMHLLFNMLPLWFFGPPLEYRWGTAAFVKFYVFTGFMAGLVHGILAPFLPGAVMSYYMFGASGAIFGVLLAFAIYYPEQRILLWFLVPIPARVLVILFAILTILGLMGGAGGISHLTHLAGFAMAYLWIWLRGRYGGLWPFNNDPAPFGRRRGYR